MQSDYAKRLLRSSILSNNEAARREMLKSLGIMLSTDGADLLEERLKDRKELLEMRLEAIKYLKDLGLTSSLEIFKTILEDRTEDDRLRAEAAYALKK